MGFRRSLDMIKRRKWSILTCGIVVGAAVGGLSTLRAPAYTAEARVRLVAPDAANRIDPLAIPGPTTVSDPALNAFARTTSSTAVAKRAATDLPHAAASSVVGSVSAHRIDATDQVAVVARNGNRARATRTANAFARAAIAARQLAAVGTLQGAVDALDPQLASLKSRMADLDAQVRARTGAAAATAQLDAVATQFETLQSRQQDLRRAADGLRPGAVLVRPATIGTTSTDRHPLRDGIVGGLAGLLLGLAIATMRELLDERVRTTEEVERLTGLPVLAELPRDQRAKQQPSRVAVFVSPKSALSEATRALRAGIELRDVDRHPSSILITSAASGEGKSLVSANLAAAYAVAGYRTVLIDADLRTPRLSSMFGTYPEPLIASGEVVHGLSSLLRALTFPGADRPGLEQAALLRTPVENLLVIPAGPEPSNPAELLDSRAMAGLLTDLGAFAEVVIIDAPPMLPVSDAVGLARHADGVVLVAAVGESERRALRRISLMLAAHPRVLGIVVNKVAPSAAYAAYVPRRRGAGAHPSTHPSATRGTLRVVQPIAVAMPPTGMPDENGDMWIDLSEDTDPYMTVRDGELQLNSWGR